MKINKNEYRTVKVRNIIYEVGLQKVTRMLLTDNYVETNKNIQNTVDCLFVVNSCKVILKNNTN